MRTAVAVVLTALYLGVSLTLGAVRPGGGFPLWFFVPAVLSSLAMFAAEGISAVLPMPWTAKRRYGSPPRRVRLSWRSAVRLPPIAPVFVLPWNFFSILRLHFAVTWVLYVVAPPAALALAALALRLRREIRLLRSGAVAAGVIDDRSNIGEGDDEIAYRFAGPDGESVSARARERGYPVRAGSLVPVFYDVDNPRNHVAACASWFEAD